MKKLTSQTLNIILIVAYLLLGVTLFATPYVLLTIPCFIIAILLGVYYFFVIRKKPIESAFKEPEVLGEVIETPIENNEPIEVDTLTPEEEDLVNEINIDDTLAHLIQRDALLDRKATVSKQSETPDKKSRWEAALNFISIALMAVAVLIAVALILELF